MKARAGASSSAIDQTLSAAAGRLTLSGRPTAPPSKSCGTAPTSAAPDRLARAAGPSGAAERLLEAQRSELAEILRKVEAAAPKDFRKTGHWAWYVWPTAKEGMNDYRQTAVTNDEDAVHVLTSESTRLLWQQVLAGLGKALRAQRSKKAFPTIDHGRIDYFCREWSATGRQQAIAAFPEFAASLASFVEAWRACVPSGSAGAAPGIRPRS